jgi:hypothetical protein
MGNLRFSVGDRLIRSTVQYAIEQIIKISAAVWAPCSQLEHAISDDAATWAV